MPPGNWTLLVSQSFQLERLFLHFLPKLLFMAFSMLSDFQILSNEKQDLLNHNRGRLGKVRKGDFEERVLNQIEKDSGSSIQMVAAMKASSQTAVYYIHTIYRKFKD